MAIKADPHDQHFLGGTNPVQENNRDSHFFSEYPAMYFWTLNLKILLVLFVKGENKIIEPFNCPHMELRHVPSGLASGQAMENQILFLFH
jgi:hypothetical protein